ncbi:hypothetical protein HMPREF9104_00807 [Lentilactobacillus kisonensis F0435]|uniref:Uncharacterized protein n=1 Tax=Lentilactobacillus kisonensis F0435 TaxID=797516 RepID=H1LDY1_9LACO|nr:hypothetical protein HMPREF9104_00807 [Lentilactobacillus kisonensis F0435]
MADIINRHVKSLKGTLKRNLATQYTTTSYSNFFNCHREILPFDKNGGAFKITLNIPGCL